jgi:hypothetical protein
VKFCILCRSVARIRGLRHGCLQLCNTRSVADGSHRHCMLDESSFVCCLPVDNFVCKCTKRGIGFGQAVIKLLQSGALMCCQSTRLCFTVTHKRGGGGGGGV